MEITLDIGSKKYVVKSDDNYLRQFNESFEPYMVKLFESVAKGSIIDVGANIGCTALLFSTLGERVDAFEPSRSTFEILKQNTSVEPNIFIHNIGLGDEVGKSQITYSANNRAGAFVSKDIEVSDGHVTENIELSTLDNFVENQKQAAIDFIKIDVEGFELNVLRGAKKTLQAFRPTVALEMNHWCLNAFRRTSIPDFLDQLKQLFPHLYAIEGDTYLNLHDPKESYMVMYHHILHMKYPNIIGSFEEHNLVTFFSRFRHTHT